VLVQDGDLVAAGQPLVELDPTAATADKATVEEQVRSSDSELLRVHALIDALDRGTTAVGPRGNFPAGWSAADRQSAQAQLAAEWSDLVARLSRLSAEAARRQAEMGTVREVIGKLEATLPLARQREQDAGSLADQGFAPRHMAQDRSRERLELERDLAMQRARLAESQATLKESDSARAAYLAETRRALQDRQTQATFRRQQAAQEQTKVAQRERLTVLTAPVAGTVQQLAVHTGGGVVTEAQALMVIVPADAQVAAEVVIENKDVGFVEIGQAVEIKLEPFMYTRYGTVHAVVSRLAADAVVDDKRGAVFPATLALANDRIDVDGKSIRLSPGMNLSAEIRTGRRTIAEQLFSPVAKAVRESLHER
jgi:hemolysin D